MFFSGYPELLEGSAIPAIEDSLAYEEHLNRVLASRRFAKSPRLAALLRFVFERSLSGAVDELSETQIGIHVFGRPASYNPGDDNVVRANARLLRLKLEAYYSEEGRGERERIVIPRGGYRLHFELIQPAPPEDAPFSVMVPDEKDDAPGSEPAVMPLPARWPLILRVIAAALVLGCAGIATVYWLRPAAPSAQLWRAMFQADTSTIVVPSDSALVLAEDYAHRRVGLDEYVSGAYRDGLPQPEGLRFSARRYTGIVDLELVAKLFRMPQAIGSNRVSVRYARDLRTEEIKTANLIFTGAPYSNPWIELFEKQMNFHMEIDYSTMNFAISNAHPRPGEEARYDTHLKDKSKPIYGLVAFMPNGGSNGQHVILLEGTTIAGTESAIDFVLNNARLDAFLKNHPRKDGPPHFEALLETEGVAGTSPVSRIAAFRFY